MKQPEMDISKMGIEELILQKGHLKQDMDEMIKKKKEVDERYHYLLNQYTTGIMTKGEYQEKINKILENRTPEQWIKYYDDYINHYKSQINRCEQLIVKCGTSKKKCVVVVTILVIVALLITGLMIYFLK